MWYPKWEDRNIFPLLLLRKTNENYLSYCISNSYVVTFYLCWYTNNHTFICFLPNRNDGTVSIILVNHILIPLDEYKL